MNAPGNTTQNFKNGIVSAPESGAVTISDIFMHLSKLYINDIRKNKKNIGISLFNSWLYIGQKKDLSLLNSCL
jgi:hypothetical protein